MVTFPHCKINLGLHVIRKRQDGYHDIETCFYPVPWTDILEIIPSDEYAYTHSGLDVSGAEEDNLCVKVFRMLQRDFGIGNVKMHLHKILPMGAGLGGGSSDATHALTLLNRIFNMGVTGETMKKYASKLGSDCSFFLQDKAVIGTGRGNELHSVNVSLRGKCLVIVYPPVHVSTADAYQGVTPSVPRESLRKILESSPVHQWKEDLVNDFEVSVFRKYPLLARLKEDFYAAGAVYASMSGSGSAVFGIFDDNNPDLRAFASYTSWSGTLSL